MWCTGPLKVSCFVGTKVCGFFFRKKKHKPTKFGKNLAGAMKNQPYQLTLRFFYIFIPLVKVGDGGSSPPFSPVGICVRRRCAHRGCFRSAPGAVPENPWDGVKLFRWWMFFLQDYWQVLEHHWNNFILEMVVDFFSNGFRWPNFSILRNLFVVSCVRFLVFPFVFFFCSKIAMFQDS